MLRKRLLRLVLGISVGFFATFCVILYVADEWIEDAAIESLLISHMDGLIASNVQSDHRDAPSRSFKYFRPHASGYLPAELKKARLGATEDIAIGGQPYLVLARRIADQDIAYLAYPIGFVESRERWLWLGLGMTGIGMLMLATLATNKLANHLLAPLLQLLDQIRALDTRERHWRLKSTEDEPELNAIIQTLNRRLTEIEQLMERERAFAAAASHELRGPLTVAMINTQLLEETAADHQLKNIARLQRATSAMNEMLDSLLALSRLQDSPEIQHLQLDEKLPRIADSLMNDLPKTVEWELTPVALVAAPGAVRIVFGNLLRNALQASADGHIRIGLTGHAVTIDDNGPGFPQEIATRLFEPGFRGREGGSGMGLYIAHQIASRYGWTLRLTNRPEGGTRAIWGFGQTVTEQ